MINKLSNISPRGLLLLFIGLTSLIFGLVSFVVISDESESSIKQIQNDNGQFELASAKIFIDKYLEVAEDKIVLASQYQGVIDAVINNDIEEVAYQLKRFQGQHQTMKFAVRDINGSILYEDTFRHPAATQEAQIFDAIKYSKVDERIVYLLHDDTNHICLKLFMPLIDRQQIVGVLYGEVAVDYEEFFGSFITGRERWYALSQSAPPIDNLTLASDNPQRDAHHNHTDTTAQPSLANLVNTDVALPVSITNPQDWITTQVKLDQGNLVLTQGLSQSFLEQQLLRLQQGLFKGLLLVLIISSVLVVLIGTKLFVNPHKELDASKRKLEASNAQLQEKEQESHLLATVVRAARDAVVITDNQGNIEWVNHAFETMTGYHLDSIRGRTPGSFLQGPDTDTKTTSKIGQAIRAGDQIKAEILNYTINNIPYWVDIDIIPLRGESGSIERYIAIERDVTDVKQLERDLEAQALKAKHANEAKSSFLATMSHEIRTPMNGLLGLLQMLIDDIEKTEHKDVLKLALNSGEHLISILNDILDLAKIENQALHLDPHPFAMQDIVNPVVSTYQSLCSEKGIQFECHNHCSADDTFNGDAVRIRQVLLNLVGNALKFTEAGEIKVAIKPLLNSKVQFTVEDSGIGIAPERLSSIFNEFEQADVSTTRHFGGTGLGLSICQKLVSLMNGQLTVESEVDVGSQFSFIIHLPKIQLKSIQETHAPKVEDFSQIYALIVDDNKVNQIIAKGFLDKLGIRCKTCSSGLEALDKIHTDNFNLLIIDNHMPELNGAQTVEKLRTQGFNNLVIFGWTADIMQDSTQSFMKAGANTVLPKPLVQKDLMQALSQYLPTIIGYQQSN